MDEQEMIRFLRSELYQAMERDPELRAALKHIDAGKGTFQDTAQYSERTSELLGQILSRHVDELPEGMRETVCKALLRERYEEVNGICAEVQETQDEPLGIRLQPQRAPYPAKRVQQVAHALEDPTVALSVIQRRAKAPVANVSKSFHDDYMRENARIREKLGLKPLIIRYGSGCCSWCSAVAGRYRFGEAPDDVFRRHDNCDCTIIYDTQVLRGERTEGGGRSKKWVEVDPAEVEANGFKPVVNSQERAAEIEQTALSRLTLAGERDIINARDMANGMRKSPLIPLSENDKKHLMSEIKAIEADPSKFVFRDGHGTGYSDELDVVFVSSNVFPSEDGSKHPRDLMSERATLAHEYYGHRAHRGTTLEKGAWNDEFRASYCAAKNCPNLSDEDRAYLILDAIERAHEAGVTIKYNDFMRRVLYG